MSKHPTPEICERNRDAALHGQRSECVPKFAEKIILTLLRAEDFQGWLTGFSAGFSNNLGSTVGLNSNDVYWAVLES